MQQAASIQSKRVILVIADISGYTRFLLENRATITQSHLVVLELLESILEQARLPLQLCKIEGDAVFLYAADESGGGDAWKQHCALIGSHLVAFFEVFRKRLAELKESPFCIGDACKLIDDLRLKVVVHAGEADFFTLGGFDDLAGLDVITVHRLLKNSVTEHEYILLTASALQEISFPEIICVETNEEQYPDIGTIHTYVYYPTNSRKNT